MEFRVDLDIFRGPLDLLLYLVRKHEVEIVEIPIAPIAAQFMEYLELLQQLDVNAVGEFLDMATNLMEIKSRMVLPRGDEEQGELDDPRHELVRQLLEYKKFKDAASILEERGRQWQDRFPRLANDLPGRPRSLAEEPLHEVELWDLVSALGRIMRENVAARPSNIVYDDTPIHVYMSRIYGQLLERRKLAFSELFARDLHKSTAIGIFLAILELVRHHGVRTEQSDLFGEIWILPGADAGPLDLSQADDYEPQAPVEDGP